MSASDRILHESLKFVQKVYEIFLDAGWNVKKEWISNPGMVDFALFDLDNNLVGAVETKRYTSRTNPQNIKREKDRASKMILNGEILFYILFVNENAYIYTERGFIKLNDIPRPDNYRSILENETIEMGEILRPSYRPIQIQQPNKEKTDDAVSPEMKQLLEMVKALSAGQAAILKGQEEMHEKLDRISEQIETLSEKISDYQALTERQLKLAESEEEVEKIISVFSEEVVSRIQRSFNANYEENDFRQEEQSLMAYFGDTWGKVSEQSKKYLISARLMFKKQSVLGNLVDYSGVCLLVTKALELEMSRRFYSDYVNYLGNRFGNTTSDLNQWPDAFTKEKRDNVNNTWIEAIVPEHSFTLVLLIK